MATSSVKVSFPPTAAVSSAVVPVNKVSVSVPTIVEVKVSFPPVPTVARSVDNFATVNVPNT